MTDIMNTALSGLSAYRTALGITSENVANANTEGYHRRDAIMTEQAGARASLYDAGQSGQGVRVTDIRRAFDDLLAGRSRTATSNMSAAETYLPAIERLEERMTPGMGGLTDMLDQFFDALGGAASAPDDIGLRSVVMSAAEGLSSAVSDMAVDIQSMLDGLYEEATSATERVNTLIQELAATQGELSSSPSDANRNPLLDERDQLLVELSDLVQISVTYDETEMARVTLGTTSGGPILLDESNYASVSVTDDLRLEVRPAGTGQTAVTRAPTGGMLKGLADATGAVTEALNGLNRWASNLADDMNALHAMGLDLNGQPGGDLFSLDGFAVEASSINRGNSFVEVVMTDTGPVPDGPLEFVHDNGVWRAFDGAGNVLGEDSSRLTLPGVTVTFTGDAETADFFRLTENNGAAANMRMVLNDPERLAAAGPMTVSTAAGNTGTSSLSAVLSDPLPADGITELETLFGTTATALDAVEFLSPGVVGMIPAGATSATLMSLGTQSSMEFTVSGGALGGAGSLNVTVDGTTYDIPLATGAPYADDAALASALNGDTLMTADEETLADLGLYASVQNGMLRLTAASGTIDAAALSGAAGTPVSLANSGAEMLVFTREGVQISGPPLSAAEAAALLTEGNGFTSGAVYSSTHTNSAENYRGITLSHSSSSGDFATVLGTGTTPQVWSGTTPAAPASATTAEVWIDGVGQGTLAIPEGSSAARAADLIADRYDVAAVAETHVVMSAPADGTLTFSLSGDNLYPLELRVSVTGGSMANVANVINQSSGQTGITASLSPDGARLLLSHSSGEDITITNLTHSGGAGVDLSRADAQGQPIGGGAVTLGTGNGSARFSGEITVTSAAAFELDIGGTSFVAARDPMQGGLMTRTIGAGGSQQVFDFAFEAGVDGSASGLDDAVAGAASYTAGITLPDGSVWEATATSLDGPITSADEAASALANAFREEAPTSTLTGTALASLPAEGASTSVFYGGQRYDLTMTGGEVVVTGPEDGRVTASFDASNQLVVETTGDTDGASLVLPNPPRNALAWGLSGATTSVTGREFDVTDLPAGASTMAVELGGVSYDITLNRSGGSLTLTPEAGFPGTASFDAGSGTITFEYAASSGAMRIDAQTVAGLAGLKTAGAAMTAIDGQLTVTATDGRALDIAAGGMSLAQERLTLDNLPNEDLIVVMNAPGALRLAAGFTIPDTIPQDRPVEVRVLDGATGQVGLFDVGSDDMIATRFLDDDRGATFGGYAVTFTAGYETGDTFTLIPGLSGSGDGRNLEMMADLRTADPDEGRGGFATLYNRLLTDVASDVKVAEIRKDNAVAVKDSIDKAEAEKTGVDLDAEAAKLMQQQQAYQANAQVLTVARQLFDTLLQSL